MCVVRHCRCCRGYSIAPEPCGEMGRELDKRCACEFDMDDPDVRPKKECSYHMAIRQECERLRKRLEIDHAYRLQDGKLVRVPLEPGADYPDGIECRDATIALLEEECERLRITSENWRMASERAEQIVEQLRAEAAWWKVLALRDKMLLSEFHEEYLRGKRCICGSPAGICDVAKQVAAIERAEKPMKAQRRGKVQ